MLDVTVIIRSQGKNFNGGETTNNIKTIKDLQKYTYFELQKMTILRMEGKC